MLSRIDAVIKRRILVNYRADPDAVARVVPRPLRVKTIERSALVGVCLIRIEHVRAGGTSLPLAGGSENAAYRIAIEWTGDDGTDQVGVYIPRRDTSSALQRAFGGLLFPAQYGRAAFEVVDPNGGLGSCIDVHVRSADGAGDVDVVAVEADRFPSTSCFPGLEAASAFFAAGSVGYSPARGTAALDGLRLDAERWEVRPLRILHGAATFLSASMGLRPRDLELDCALLMRDVPHSWHALPPMRVGDARGAAA